MDLKLLREEENKLLNRKKVFYEAEGPTPKRSEVLEKIAALTGKDKKLISVKKISPVYGSAKAIIEVNVYEDLESRMKYEPIKEEEGKENEAKE